MNKALIEIEGKEIERLECRGKPVVTFRMIDELHEKNDGSARHAFFRHKERFVENEDFFEVPYDDWKKITAVNNINGGQDTGQRNPIKFLTESGYLMLVKPFNDDLAWKIQRALVNNYFAVKQFREDYSYADELDKRAKAINSELRALRADNSFRKQAETEARNIMQGKKTVDDLAGYPRLREAVKKILENSECREHENYAVLFFQAVWRLWQTCGEKTAAFFDLREDDREAWIHMPDALRAVRNGKGIREVLGADKNRLYDDLKNHPAYMRGISHRFRGKNRKGWCFDTDKIRIQ